MGARTRKLFRTALMSGLKANGLKLDPKDCFDKAYVLDKLFNFNIDLAYMRTVARQCSEKLREI